MSMKSARPLATARTQASSQSASEGECNAICSAVQKNVESTYKKIIDEQPLSQHFPFDYMFECYIWRAVFLTSFTLGVRFGGLNLVESVITTVLPRPLLFLLIYIVIPPSCLYLNKKYPQQDVTVAERRVLLILVAALLGIGSGSFNICYFLASGPPSYFIPGLVGLSVQLLGPHLGKARRELLLSSIGSALVFGIALAGISGGLTIYSFLSLCIAATFAAVNLQILISDILNGEADMTETHITAVGAALYQHLFFSRFFGTYAEFPQERTRLSLRKALLN